MGYFKDLAQEGGRLSFAAETARTLDEITVRTLVVRYVHTIGRRTA